MTHNYNNQLVDTNNTKPTDCSFQVQSNASQDLYRLQYQEELNRMREKLFRMLSKVPIQVETVNCSSDCVKLKPLVTEQNSSASTSSQPECQQQAPTTTRSTATATRHKRVIDRKPLLIKYYNERCLNEILDLHFNCSLMNQNHLTTSSIDSTPVTNLSRYQASQTTTTTFPCNNESCCCITNCSLVPTEQKFTISQTNNNLNSGSSLKAQRRSRIKASFDNQSLDLNSKQQGRLVETNESRNQFFHTIGSSNYSMDNTSNYTFAVSCQQNSALNGKCNFEQQTTIGSINQYHRNQSANPVGVASIAPRAASYEPGGLPTNRLTNHIDCAEQQQQHKHRHEDPSGIIMVYSQNGYLPAPTIEHNQFSSSSSYYQSSIYQNQQLPLEQQSNLFWHQVSNNSENGCLTSQQTNGSLVSQQQHPFHSHQSQPQMIDQTQISQAPHSSMDSNENGVIISENYPDEINLGAISASYNHHQHHHHLHQQQSQHQLDEMTVYNNNSNNSLTYFNSLNSHNNNNQIEDGNGAIIVQQSVVSLLNSHQTLDR